ncbi:MAG: sulfatase-like hydrolase/transferase [Burkholderiales bacterium]|nr:sulfatase-like hydrolase/transferase [Burkholderiales bacterium]
MGAAIGVGTAFFGVCLAHLTVLGALSSWGQLPTIEMVAAYLHELKFVESALGVGRDSFVLVLCGIWCACVALHFVLLAPLWRRAVTESAARPTSLRQAGLAVLLLAVALPSFAAWYVGNPWFESFAEPFWVALNGGRWRASQTTVTSDLRIQQLQKLDDAARANYIPSLAPTRKNVVLITVDALRPDHMSTYGYARKTTPFLDRLVREGRAHVAKEARGPCAESFCGLLSLLTGKSGHKLAQRDFGLAEVLGQYGYYRRAILGGDHSRFYGLRERYGPFDSYTDGGLVAGAQSVNDDEAVVSQVEALPSFQGKPEFLFVHLMSAHGLGRKYPEFQKWTPAKSVYNLRAKNPDATFLQEVANAYDNGVLQADAMIGRMMTALSAKGYLGDAIVFVTGDHGDLLGEHNQFSHSKTLLEPVIRVPWIWIGEAARALPLDRPVVHADFAPTLLNMLNIVAPSHWDGRTLQRGAVLNRSFHQQGEWVGVIDYSGAHTLKYLIDQKKHVSAVYDLTADPAERKDITSSIDQGRLAAWRRALEAEQLLAPYACRDSLNC